MLVDVVMMRSEGVKRPRDDLLAAQPLRGELVVHTAGPTAYAILTRPWQGPTAAGTALPQLQQCRIRTIKGDTLMLHGLEFVGMHHERRQVPQAWWCKVLPESERPAS